jgi:DNA repair exonuclease SbcCD nuclease subunit
MKILAIADTHFENKNEIETNLMCDRIYEVVLNQKPDIIVSLGDNLHTHELIHMGPLKRAIGFLHKLSQMCLHLYVLVGNHDRSNNMSYLTEDSPFVACKMWPNTTIVDKVYTGSYQGFNLAFVPYVPVGRFTEALSTEGITDENISKYDVIFAHQEFKNSKMGAIVSSNGDEWPVEYPLVISGHIHDYQEVQSNLIYPGTPIQLGYGCPPSKGVMMLNLIIPDSGTQNLETEISKTKIEHEFYDLKLPKKMIVHITPEELSSYQIPDNCFVKLVCKGNSKSIREITKLDSVKEMLKNPRIKLSIQEDRSKVSINGVNIDVGVSSKVDTIPFQKRLYSMFKTQNDDIKNLFTTMFGKIEE